MVNLGVSRNQLYSFLLRDEDGDGVSSPDYPEGAEEIFNNCKLLTRDDDDDTWHAPLCTQNCGLADKVFVKKLQDAHLILAKKPEGFTPGGRSFKDIATEWGFVRKNARWVVDETEASEEGILQD